ncbi:MAG: hypothetical protein QXN55_00660 [Candidatus Nitrosotenuis sp.]
MRAYFFGNYYLSQIQQGIQGLHAVVELFTQAESFTSRISVVDLPQTIRDQITMLYDWATNHKTVVFLNGGNQADLQELDAFLSTGIYPTSRFYEDEKSLNNALTSVCVILPEKIYEGAKIWQARTRHSEFEQDRRFQKWVSIDKTTAMELREDGTLAIAKETDLDGIQITTYTEWERNLMEMLVTYRLA